MKEFKYWDNEFSQQNMALFNSDEISGEIYLKVRSIYRKDLLDKLVTLNKLENKPSMEELYNLVCSNKISIHQLNNFIDAEKKNDLDFYKSNFELIRGELFKVQHYSWGGDQVNSLDKKIVSIIKSNYSYDDIISQIDNQIKSNVERYTLNSWYNNWSSSLTEYLFKKEDRVFPALGKIKSVDFFIDNIPLDLKITFFPQGYLKFKRKTNEVTELKKLGRKYGCSFDIKESDDLIKYQISEQLKNMSNAVALQELNALLKENTDIINDSLSNPSELIHWLYENQGEMRFGSENRLFLILVDRNSLPNSWKLKRDFNLQEKVISDYIIKFKKSSLRNVDFNFKGKRYTSLADCIFILT